MTTRKSKLEGLEPGMSRLVPAVPVTTYEIERKSETIRVTVPSSWKVTFGPVQPGKPNYQEQNCLRFYETEKQQRAIFTEVKSFRDLSIRVQRLRKDVERKSKGAVIGNTTTAESEEKVTPMWEEVPF